MCSVFYLLLITLTTFHLSVKVKSVSDQEYKEYVDDKNFMDMMTSKLKLYVKGFREKLQSLLQFSKPKRREDQMAILAAQLARPRRKYDVNQKNKYYEMQIAKNQLPVRIIKHRPSLRSKMNTGQLVRLHGYKLEIHKVLTHDGYILEIHRILTNNKPSNDIAILHHGLLTSSEDWLLVDSELALPCILSEYGYDVWLLNARGSKYSTTHKNLQRKSYDYWNFSWHEIGMYDLAASISYISDKTSKPDTLSNLYYIGHSMGATALLVLLSSVPEYNDVLKMAVFLAPLAFMKHCKGPIRDLHKTLLNRIVAEPAEYQIDPTYLSLLLDQYCPSKNCINSLLLLTKMNSRSDIGDVKQDVFEHSPGEGSVKTLLHYMQLVESGGFQLYDYGDLINRRTYRTSIPPSYNLSIIRVPVVMFSSISDVMANEMDIHMLTTQLPSLRMHYIVKEKEFTHYDYVWSSEAVDHIYINLIHELETMSKHRKRTFMPMML